MLENHRSILLFHGDEYLVEWESYPLSAASWEPRGNLTNDLLDSYDAPDVSSCHSPDADVQLYLAFQGILRGHGNITSSFKATGIYPMNRNLFPNDAFLSAAVTDKCVDVNTPATEPAPSTSQGSPAASTIQGSLAASTRKGSPESSERHTPEELWPYPKAAPRKATATKRKKKIIGHHHRHSREVTK